MINAHVTQERNTSIAMVRCNSRSLAQLPVIPVLDTGIQEKWIDSSVTRWNDTRSKDDKLGLLDSNA